MVRRRPSRLARAGLLVVVLGFAGIASAQDPALAAQEEKPYGLPLRGAEAEAFLKAAQVVETKELPYGVTHSQRLTLTDGTRTLKAAWKTIDERQRGVKNLEGGGLAVDFVDSWKYEVASYELDKLLGFDLVPPTVERQVNGKTGSLQMWVEGVVTEWDRMKQKRQPPDAERWNRQIHSVRLLHALTFNTDYKNLRNELVDPDFRVYAIDFTRAFRVQAFVPTEKDLQRFPRGPIEKMRALDRPTLVQALGQWLTGAEIDGLLKRRDRILGIVDKRVRAKGEATVLFP